MNFIKKLFFITLFACYSINSYAELNIDISKDVETTVPIAVVPFASTSNISVDVSAIIRADLSRSGYFKTLADYEMLTRPSRVNAVKFRNWQVLGQEYLLIGRSQQQNNRYEIMFQLLDVYKGELLMDYKVSATSRGLRRAAHQISDLVYEKLTGKKGVFGTKVAFVSTQEHGLTEKIYQLQIADVDGFNAKTIVSSKEPIMSPAWSPDGKQIAYVSFESYRAVIFIQILATGQRVKISSFKGINGAPAWSRDGSKLALTLSKDGNPNVYVMDLTTKRLLKLTHSGINTEPTWSPDGRSIVFTSNQSGQPQLYSVASTGGRISRLSFTGDYNATASFSPDGKKIALVHANQGVYKIAIMDVATRKIKALTSGNLDESPSFSANGAMILYATRQNGQGVLSAVSIDGRIHQKLEFQNPEVREPAWAP